MADNFNLAKFLRNNPLLNESIGGYKDIEPMKEDTGYKVVATNDDNDLDPSAIAKAIPGFDPNNFEILYKGDPYGGWQDNPNTAAVIASLKSGDGEFIAKKNSKLKEGYEDDDDQGFESQSGFEAEYDDLVDAIDEGFGWIDPAFVKDTWESSSDIPFKSIASKLYAKLFVDDFLYNPNDEDPGSDVPGEKVTEDELVERGFLTRDQVKELIYNNKTQDHLGMNEGSDDIDYADYGVDPNDPDADTIVSFMQDMRDINNMEDPSFIDNFKTWLKGIKSDYQFNKRFKNSPFKMNEAEKFTKDPSSQSMAEKVKSIKAILKNYPQAKIDDLEKDREGMTFTIVFTKDINNKEYSNLIDKLEVATGQDDAITSDYEGGKIYVELLPPYMGEAEEEDAYFDYKNNRRSFLPSPDEFQGALDSSEMSQQDFMMSLAHKDFDGDVSAIVKKTIDGLRAGGFDDQDIVDFLATDFSLDEEVSEVQMETRMISYDSDKQIDGKLYDVDLGFKSFRAVYDADNEEFIFQYPDKGGRKSISKYDDSIKRVELHNPIKSPFSDPGYKNRD